jgi:hypothetical protein
MNKLDEMWTVLAAYQPKADAEGHGETWATMCQERTSGAAMSARAAAYAAGDADAAGDAKAAVAAGDAEAAVADAEAAVAEADRWAQKVIDRINKLKGENKHD